jgi:hypothetical protein
MTYARLVGINFMKHARLVEFSLVLGMVALSAITSRGANWFVNNTAAGLNNGSSFANGWTSFAAINWAAINPGDNIYISGGPTASSKVYNETLTVGKAGSLGNLITIGVKADDASHNGTIIIGGGNYIEMSGIWYIKLNGYVAGEKHFLIRDTFNTTTAEFANAIMAPQTAGTYIDSLSVSNVNNAFNLNDSANYTLRRTITRQMRGDAILRASGSFGTLGLWDSNMIEENDWECASGDIPGNFTQGLGPDGMQIGHNTTIRNNTFRVKKYAIVTSIQHTDMIQAAGTYLNIYGNDFQNVGDSCVQLHGWFGQAQKREHIHIFNNVFRILEDIDPFPQYIRLYNVSVPITNITDLVIANNLFLDNRWQNIETVIRDFGAAPTGSGNYLVNNIFSVGSGATGTLFWNLDLTSMPGAWTINGNSYYAGGNVVKYNNVQQACTTWIANEPQGVIGMPTFASYTYRDINNNLHLSGSDVVARDTGVNLSSFFTTDKDGLARVVPWDKGPYEYPSSGVSSLSVASTTASVAENAGLVTLTFRRSGSIVGVVGCSYATANGSASAGVNYTLTSGTLSWSNGDGADKTVSVPVINTSMLDTKTFTMTISSATGGAVLGATTTTVSITGTGTPGTPLLPGWGPWNGSAGEIAAPYIISGTDIYQNSDISNPADGGSARYTFTNSLGDFRVKIVALAPDTAHNSVWCNMTNLPTEPTMVYDIPVNAGYQTNLVTWRGTGTPDTAEFSPKIWSLPAGTNTFIIRGREPGTYIRSVQLDPVIPEPPPGEPVIPTVVSVTTTNLTGYYKTNIVIPFTITFSTNVTVTGTPIVSMNSGGTANYFSGSGSTNLIFRYAIGAGENAQTLDYAATNSLSLNSGTIKNDTNNATLWLPVPGAAGSLSMSSIMAVDTTKPAITFGNPLVNYTNILLQVTYFDLNLVGNNLDDPHLTLNTTGTVTGTANVVGGGTGSVAIRISNITGTGTLSVTLAANTAVDLAGNIADGTTTPIMTVESVRAVNIRSGDFRSMIIGR